MSGRSTKAIVLASLVLCAAMVRSDAAPTPAQPGSPQPTIPAPMPGIGSVPEAGGSSSAATPTASGPTTRGRKSARWSRGRSRHARRHYSIERPALANVELLEPLPRPPQPPHFTVPAPAYPLENFVTAYTTPPPPIVCHRVRREPGLPDPRLLYEKPVVCEADNP